MSTIVVTVTDAVGNAATASASYTVSSGLTAPVLVGQIQTETRVLVTWAAIAGATGSYDFYRNGAQLGNTPSPDWLDPDVTPGVTYSYTARARTSAGVFGPQSTPLRITTPIPPPPPPPPPGYPDATNTGVPAGTALTPRGQLTITTAGAVVEGLDITGGVVVAAANVTIRKCRIRSSTQYVIKNNSTGLLVEDCEIDGLNGTGNSMGLGDGNLTVRRCNIHGTENGFNVGGPTIVEDSWIHDLYTGGGAHTDGMQFNQGASGITVRHNTIVSRPGSTSCIIMWDEGNPQNRDVLIENNRLLGPGAAYTIYTPRQGPLSNVRIRNNRMLPAGYGYNGGNQALVTEWSGNVNDSTGAPV